MPWDSATLARVAESIAIVHRSQGETVYIKRHRTTQPDDVYSEDLTKREDSYRIEYAIVERNPTERRLSQFGRTEPVDLIVTFDRQTLNQVGLDTVEEGDIIVYKGVRHRVLKDKEAPKMTTEVTGIADVVGSPLQFSVLAMVGDVPVVDTIEPDEPGYVPPPASVIPTLTAIALVQSSRVVSLVFDKDIQIIGDAKQRFRVSVNRVTAILASVTKPAANTISLTLDAALPVFDPDDEVIVSYESANVDPVTNGITNTAGVTAAHEIAEFINVEATNA